MGCGQSQFSSIYPKKFKRKGHKNEDGEEDNSDEVAEDDKLANGLLISNKSMSNLVAAVEKENRLNNTKFSSNEMSSSSSLLAHKETSSSQLEFFKMLDEKIEKGPDHDDSNEEENLLEITRIRQLLLEWELAKQKRLPALSQHYFHYQHHHHNQINQQVQIAGDGGVTPPRKFRFTVPYLNGDVDKKFPFQIYAIRQQLQYSPQNKQSSQFTLSNSVVMYDESRGSRGQYYTELA